MCAYVYTDTPPQTGSKISGRTKREKVRTSELACIVRPRVKTRRSVHSPSPTQSRLYPTSSTTTRVPASELGRRRTRPPGRLAGGETCGGETRRWEGDERRKQEGGPGEGGVDCKEEGPTNQDQGWDRNGSETTNRKERTTNGRGTYHPA